jgi:hypothetical protein
LRIHGFIFEAIGDEVDVYGPVRPYLGKIEIMEQEVAKRFPKFFNYFTQDQEIQQQNISHQNNSPR